jgi:hypothetical protein
MTAFATLDTDPADGPTPTSRPYVVVVLLVTSARAGQEDGEQVSS